MENMEKKDAGLPAGKKKRKIPWSMLYILATVVAVLLFGLFNQQFGNVFHTISNLTPGFLSLGVLISLVYFLFEGEIFRLLLRSQGYRIQRLDLTHGKVVFHREVYGTVGLTIPPVLLQGRIPENAAHEATTFFAYLIKKYGL